MTLAQLIEKCGDDVSFQILNQCLQGNQKLTKHGTQITFVAPGVPITDLVSKKPGQVGLVVWLPGDRFREIMDAGKPDEN
jgi:hypothetical protein